MANSQPVRFKSALPADDLLFRSMHGTEELGRIFSYDLELLSLKDDIALDDVLGQEATVEFDLPSGDTRYFNGIIARFAQTGQRGAYIVYQAELRPWLWFLTRTADCRIFQEQTVPDIVKSVFRDHGFSDFEDTLSGTYRTWEYCVQYRETDYNFVSRLLEQEGIYFYFKHQDGKHTLVLADAYGAHAALPGYAAIPYYPPSDVVRDEHIYGWYLGRTVQSGNYVLRAFDFRKPRANLEVNASVSRQHTESEYEIFDYPGEYFERKEGDDYARRRIEELQTEHERVRGKCNARGVFAGGLFSLSEYPRDDQNREYLIVASHQNISLGDYESGGEGLEFECSFEAIESQTPHRVARLAQKPIVQGPQTAIVVGKSGEEIWTDEYGRVKVQFHWDRYGGADENSSCWVRVAQVWAGANWGAMYIPRMGQEVIVDFIEGDPDRPIITGRVYNADNMPPYDLPDNKTQSTLKSRSSKEGTPENFNEIRFEDKKGEEQVYIHAERNQDIVVENNESHSVGNDRSKSVGHDETTEIGNDRTENVGNNEEIAIANNRSESVGSDETISIGKDRTETVAKNETISIGEGRTKSVGKDESVSIGANQSLSVGADQSLSIGAAREETVGKNETVSIGTDRAHNIGKDDSLSVGKKYFLEAGDEVTIKTGSASFVMKKNGDITIKGKDITLQASGKINAKASSTVTIKGSKVAQN